MFVYRLFFAISYISDFFTFIKYISFNNFQKDQDSCRFPVFRTKSCPSNQTEWEKRSSEMNCNDNNSYMCVPNEKFTELLEFCFKDLRMLIVKGKVYARTCVRVSFIWLHIMYIIFESLYCFLYFR